MIFNVIEQKDRDSNTLPKSSNTLPEGSNTLPEGSVSQLFTRAETEGEHEIVGMLERVTFQNADNGFLVARFVSEADGELYTITGILPDAREGQRMLLRGSWEEHERYGPQFSLNGYRSLPPNTSEGMIRYLAAGFKGIGSITATRIVETFGEKTFDVIDHTPERLNEVPKLNRAAIKSLQDGWQTERQRREVLLFLHGAGISPLFAGRIYKVYGDKSLEIMQTKPYQLALKVQGIGFRSADNLARHNGLSKDDPQRLEAGLLYVLEEARLQGHTAMPRGLILRQASTKLDATFAQMEDAANSLCRAGYLYALVAEAGEDLVHGKSSSQLVAEHLTDEYSETDLNEDELAEKLLAKREWLQLSSLERAERELAEILGNLNSIKSKPLSQQITSELHEIEASSNIVLNNQQRKAIRLALKQRVLIITGGPGTGKTTILYFILALLKKYSNRLVLCAPTGKAAKRLAQATGHTAVTIHRLLEASPKGFGRNRSNRLDVEWVIVDESSMLDTTLMHALLRAMPPTVHLILVGDVDQLPSVGAGRVLGDLLRTDILPAIRLKTIFRQASASRIILNAHAILKGRMPDLSKPAVDQPQDFFFVPASSPSDAADKIRIIVTERIPQKFGLDPLKEIQVLAPMKKGNVGVDQLNQLLQAELNPRGQPFQCGLRKYRVGDRVLQTKNDYANEVFNGDLGEIVAHFPDKNQTVINF